nr:MAG: methyltransferase [Guiyang Paspalum paspaloides tymo-like virus 1]
MSFPYFPPYQPSPFRERRDSSLIPFSHDGSFSFQPKSNLYVPTPPKIEIPKTYTVPKFFFCLIPCGQSLYTRPTTPPPPPLSVEVFNGKLFVDKDLNPLPFKNVDPLPRLTGSGFQTSLDYINATQQRDVIANSLTQSCLPALESTLEKFPYSLSQSLLLTLQGFGIDVNQFGSKNHPHAAHKSIENHLLFVHWRNLATQPSSVSFMKESKFKKLQSLNSNFLELCNYHITLPDKTRYPVESEKLPSLPVLFMHDALMYFTPDQILGLFSEAPQLQVVYASLVVPPESSFTDVSLNPDLYTYRFNGDKLVYHPDNHHGGSYTQPRAALEWLRYSSIKSNTIELSITVLESWGPCHSIMIHRGIPLVHPLDGIITFKTPRCLLLNSPTGLQQNIRDRLVPTAVYDALFVYVKAVRTLRVTDPSGFVRTQMSKPEYSWVTSAAWENLSSFCLLTCAHRPPGEYKIPDSSWARAKLAFKQFVHNHPYLFSVPFTAFSMIAGASSVFISSMPSYYNLKHLSLFGKWIKPPTDWQPVSWSSFIFKGPRPAPWFSISVQRKPIEIFPSVKLMKQIQKEFPNFFDLLKRKPFSSSLFNRCLVGSMVPVVIYGLYRFFRKDHDQQTLDHYFNYFHPKDWALTLDKYIVFAKPGPFIPGKIYKTIELPKDDSRFFPALDPVRRASLDSKTLPFEMNQTLPDLPNPAETANLSRRLSKTEPELVSETLIDFSQDLERPRSSSPKPNSSDLPPKTEPLVHSVPHSPNLLPVMTEALQVDLLTSDQTATGPIMPFNQIYQAAWHPGCACFPFRARVSSSSNAPLPTGDCLLRAVSEGIGIPTQDLWNTLCSMFPDSMLNTEEIHAQGLNTEHLIALCYAYSMLVNLHLSDNSVLSYGILDPQRTLEIRNYPPTPTTAGHFELIKHPVVSGAAPSNLANIALSFKFNDHLLPFRTIHEHTTSLIRAKNLISNMKYGLDGVMAMANPSNPQAVRSRFVALDHIIDHATPRKIQLFHVAGFPGCGKTLPVVSLLKHKKFSQFKVSVPTVELRHEWKKLLNLSANDSWRVGTWESSLLKNAPILVIDEVYKLPRGYLDLAIHADPSIQFVILLGDPLQGTYHSQNISSTNDKLSPETIYLRKYIDFYCLWSYRIPRNVAGLFQVNTYSTEDGYARYSMTIPQHLKVLTNSNSTMKTFQQLGYDSCTISSSQGSTIDRPICIQLDRNSLAISNSVALVAVTRSKKGIVFSGDKSMISGAANSNHIFSALFHHKSFSFQSIFANELPNCEFIKAPITSRHRRLVGATHAPVARLLTPTQVLSQQPTLKHPFNLSRVVSDQFADVFSSDYVGDIIFDAPIQKGDGLENSDRVSTHFLPETRRPLHFDLASSIPQSDQFTNVNFSSTAYEHVYPGETFENLAAHFLEAHDPSEKEIIHQGTYSNQFPHLNVPFELSAQPSSLIAAVHNSKHDPTLLPASISKRLRFRLNDSPYSITPDDEILGSILYESLCRAYNRSPSFNEPFNQELFIDCININEYSQLTSKTQSVIAANYKRSDPDWRYTVVNIFSKTQHKVNEDSIFGNWKACQTLALMHDAVILILGPVKKYQRLFADRDRPTSTYIHAGKTPIDMSNWCQSHLRSLVKTTNDYTAFDQSQHGEAVVLERKKMECLNIPKTLIDFHLWLKCNVSTQFGPLTCMRLTGEPGTYDDNSEYNIAVINTEYNMHSSNFPYMVSGDDSLIDGVPPRNSNWPKVVKMLALKFKTNQTKYPLFCGYYVGSAGAVRAPRPLFAKLIIALDDQSIQDKLLSYLSEFLVGHSLGDSMWTLIPVEHVKFQSAVFDFFCRKTPTHLKIAFKLGEIPLSTLLSLFGAVKWASYSTYSMLSTSARRLLVKFNKSRSMPITPDEPLLYTQLLESFQMHPRLSGSSPSVPLSLQPSPDSAKPLPMANGATSSVSYLASDDRVDRLAPLPQAPVVLETQTPSILIPFQYLLTTLKGDKDFHNTWTIDSSKELLVHTRHYRHAELKSLELEFMPLASAAVRPVSVKVVWTISSIAPDQNSEVQYYGGRVVTLGGPTFVPATTHVPADLSALNPVIKSSVSYSDTPRVTLSVPSVGGATNTDLVLVLVRGKLLLSGPIGAKLGQA